MRLIRGRFGLQSDQRGGVTARASLYCHRSGLSQGRMPSVKGRTRARGGGRRSAATLHTNTIVDSLDTAFIRLRGFLNKINRSARLLRLERKAVSSPHDVTRPATFIIPRFIPQIQAFSSDKQWQFYDFWNESNPTKMYWSLVYETTSYPNYCKSQKSSNVKSD